MNDSTHQDIARLKQMLEEVTAADATVASDATAARGDAENASLREAWLALGQLIRAADASLPAMGDVLPAAPNWATPLAPQKPRRMRRLVAIAASAAALLVTATFGWWISHDGKRGNKEPSLAQTATPEQTKLLPASPNSVQKSAGDGRIAPPHVSPLPQAREGRTATTKAAKPGTTTSSTWDDSLETQIASISQQINNVEQSWQHRVDDVDLVLYRIDEVSDSLQNDAL